jgi:hypothetical protein
MTDRPEDTQGVRASDRDRDKVAAELRAHCVEGRITVEELDQRLEGVMAARMLRELSEFVSDLPTVAVEAAPAETARRVSVGPPGALPFTRRIVVPATCARTRAVVMDTIAPSLNAYGYELTSQSPNELVFECSLRPAWTLFVAVLAFPIGPVALLHRKTEQITISLEEQGSERTTMIVHGTAPRRVRKAFAQLTFP